MFLIKTPCTVYLKHQKKKKRHNFIYPYDKRNLGIIIFSLLISISIREID